MRTVQALGGWPPLSMVQWSPHLSPGTLGRSRRENRTGARHGRPEHRERCGISTRLRLRSWRHSARTVRYGINC
ncbi:MAG: hypothetical protein DME08_12165 [Candidatus Rokuibacteriota bacterium]|nr:MAG: hypothetical protein DME08_12165 [Candidatus Rokubacteria bacterium]